MKKYKTFFTKKFELMISRRCVCDILKLNECDLVIKDNKKTFNEEQVT